MSLAIDVDTIQAVLLADGWHTVHDASFTLDAYEYRWSGRPSVKVQDLENERDARLLREGGDSGSSSSGFALPPTRVARRLLAPLSAVLAVRCHVFRHGIADPGQSDGMPARRRPRERR